MTFAFINGEISPSLSSSPSFLSPHSNPSLKAEIPSMRPNSRPWSPNPSLNAQIPTPKPKSWPKAQTPISQPQVPNPSISSQPYCPIPSLKARLSPNLSLVIWINLLNNNMLHDYPWTQAQVIGPAATPLTISSPPTVSKGYRLPLFI